jgi:hypothetical protein
MLTPRTINRANVLGIALSGFGLVSLWAAWTSVPGAVNPGPLFESRSELSFLEDGWNSGQGKGYPAAGAEDALVLSQLIKDSPRARELFGSYDELSDFFRFVIAKSRQYGISPVLVLSLIDVESGFRSDAVSSRGAVGLMQLRPSTAAQLAEDAGWIWYPGLLKDPRANVELGLLYMKKLREQYAFSDTADALTAYNMGPHALREKLHSGQEFSRAYYQRVNGLFRERVKRLPRKHARLWARAWL